MLWVLLISAILAFVAQAQVNSCTLKYYTVNAFRTQNNFSFSCYGIGADCDIYYAPPGAGCSADSMVRIGTVLENETEVFTSYINFKLGGGFCSDNQIGVYSLDNSGKIEAHLPRSTEAGTKFHIPVSIKTSQLKFDCAIFALSSPAEVSISINDGAVTSLSIDSFRSKKFDFGLNLFRPSQAVTMINSDNPVIVSCIGKITFQPISSEPLLIASQQFDFVSVAISNCSTNELIEDFSKVEVTFASYETGTVCQYTRHDSDEIQVFKAESSPCVFLIEPLDNVCVSTFGVGKRIGIPYGVGIPESKLSTRFVKKSYGDNVSLFSFSETTCTGLHDQSKGQIASLFWLVQDLSSKVSFADWPVTSIYSRVECDNPILMIVREQYDLIPFLSGYQAEEMWQPWFDSNCAEAQSLTTAFMETQSLTPAQTNATTNATTNAPTNATTNAPTNATTNATTPVTSDGRSLIFGSISWVTFFGFYLFSSSLV